MLLVMGPVCHLFVLIGSRLDPITLMVENGGTIYSQDPDVSPFDGVQSINPWEKDVIFLQEISVIVRT